MDLVEINSFRKKILGKKDKRVFDENIMNYISSREEETGGSLGVQVVDNMDILASNPNVKLADYVDACIFATHFQFNDDLNKSWILTKKDRYLELVHEGKTDDVSSYATSYARRKLVQTILRSIKVSKGLLFQGEINKSIIKLANLRDHAISEKVQMESASKLIDVLMAEELNVMNVNHSIESKGGAGDIVDEISSMIDKMVSEQQVLVRSGSDLHTIANIPILEAEIE